MFKAWFKNYEGRIFSREFNTFDEMKVFIKRASKVGSKIISYVVI